MIEKVSEPKTVEEFASDLAEAASRIGPGKYLLDVLVRMVKTRDEQIRQQAAAAGVERGRQWERSEWEARIANTHVSKARVREVFLHLIDEGIHPSAETVLRRLAGEEFEIDLEDTPEHTKPVKAERRCLRCGERYFNGETRCEDECATGAGSIGVCDGYVVPADAWKSTDDGVWAGRLRKELGIEL